MSLTVIEAARISAIVEEALEKLSFLASITPDVMGTAAHGARYDAANKEF